MTRIFLVFLICASLGCVSQDRPAKTIELDYRGAPNLSLAELAELKEDGDDVAKLSDAQLWAKVQLPEDAPCIWLVDGRTRTEYLGWSFPREQMLEWLGDGVTYRLQMIARATDEIPVDDSYIYLQKAYIRHVSDTMSSIAVLRVGNGEEEAVYRGNKTRLNWFGSDKEFSRIMSEALDDALINMIDKPPGSKGCSDAGQ